MHRRQRGLAAAASLTIALLAGACSGTKVVDNSTGSSPTFTVPPTAADVKLAGLKGTAPLTDVPATLKAELRQVAPTVGAATAPDAVRPYDAVIIAALAAEEARTDSPARIASHVVDVVSGGTTCNTYADCRQLTDAQLDLHYVGASGALDLGPDGQSTDTSYGEYEFDNQGVLTKISNQSTQITAPVEPAADADPTFGPRADGVLRIGMLYPSSGPDASIADAAEGGIRAAVADVNANGGAVGRNVQLVDGDSKDGSPAATAMAASTLLGQGVDVIIGGAGQTDTAAMLDPITAAGVVLITPGSFSSTDTTATQSGLFFRLTPSDTAQGSVLANVVADDGITHVTVLDENGDLDAGMAITFNTGFTARGGTVTNTVAFAPGASASSVIDQAVAEQTNGYVILGDVSTDAQLLAELQRRNLGPSKIATYLANISPLLPTVAGS